MNYISQTVPYRALPNYETYRKKPTEAQTKDRNRNKNYKYKWFYNLSFGASLLSG